MKLGWSGQVDLNHRPHGPEPCALNQAELCPERKEPRREGAGGRRILGASRRPVKRTRHGVHSAESPPPAGAFRPTKGTSMLSRITLALLLAATSAAAQTPQ